MQTKVLKSAALGVTTVTAALLSCVAQAGAIDYPRGGAASQQVAANVPAYGNVWTGVAQSFTAQDPRIHAGFYMFNANTGADVVKYSLYSGDGVVGSLLAQLSVVFAPGAAYRHALLLADFSSVTLAPGSVYTLAATLPSESLPEVGTYSSLFIDYAGPSASSNPYAEGRFYFVGSPYDMSYPGFATRDIAFRVTPVPEPDTLVLLLAGMGFLAWAKRRQAGSSGAE